MKKILSTNKHIHILGLICALFIFLCTSLLTYADQSPLWDDYTVPATRQKERLLDEAELLSSSEQAEILGRLNEISEKQRCNVVILTVTSHSGSIEAFADDYFDYNGFGSDYNDAGIIFVLSMYTREWAISTSGDGIPAFTDYGQEEMTDEMLPYLKDGNYYGAFEVYIDTADRYLDQFHAGTPYDIESSSKTAYDSESNYDPKSRIFLSIIIGLATAIIPIAVMAAKLNTVHINNSASEYRTHDGIHMNIHTDTFLTSHVSRTRKSENNGSRSHSGGGSSFHTSSSGHSHGGSHGHF
ncbi:MAG: TPM domain-containing protein [Butyrivibrio sp.]|nr:TPM domain-containing protein [Butyrivibrio sp.]